MKAIVLADRIGRELQPLTQHYCCALLPVAGKPVVEHTLEELSEAGITEVVLVISGAAEQIKHTLGDGSRWGLAIDYFLSRGEESPRRLIGRMGLDHDTQHLLLRGDVLRSRLIKDFLEEAFQQQAGDYVEGRTCDNRAAMITFRKQGALLARLAWPLAAISAPVAPGGVLLMLPGRQAALDSLQDYHRANLHAVVGDYAGILLPGREQHEKVYVDAQTETAHLNWADACAVLGKQVKIHPGVTLHGAVVIGDGVVVEARTGIEDSVIMPGTYVGEDLNICNAIVAPELLIRVDTGAIVTVDDPFMLSDMRRAEAANYFHSIGNRAAGLLLLALSAPLWPLAALLSVMSPGRAALTAQRLTGNICVRNQTGAWEARTYADWSWNTRIPVLRRLPRLLAVLRGDLQLIGRAPRAVHACVPLSGNAGFGLLGPVQLVLPEAAPAEECDMVESYFVATRSLANDALYLLRGLLALFTRRAWWGRAAPDEAGQGDGRLSDTFS